MRIPITLPSAERSNFDVVGCGLNMVDQLITVSQHPSPDTKQPIRAMEYSPGGQVATAMVTCARLGLRARYFGRFGDDSHGKWGKSSLSLEGVDTAASLIAESTPNGFSVILVDPERATRTVLWSRDPSLNLLPSEIDASIVCTGRVLLVDCHDTAAATAAARYARAAGIPTVIDVEYVRPGIEKLLQQIDIIITAEGFPSELTGYEKSGAALRAIRDAYQPAMVCMTLGEKGSLALVEDTEIRTHGFRVPVVDTTGSGDVFRGGFIAGWLKGANTSSVADILRYANAVAALKCRGLGARQAIPTQTEVEAFLRE